jgi:hypothetical protein
MRKMVKTGAAALMLTCMASNVWAAAAGTAGCARPEDMNALKAAAIQQRLMVAALSCNAAALYNDFVRAYQKELQASDKALQNYFRRLAGVSGDERYHAYKTHLANASSMESIHNITDYCASTKTEFDASLTNTKTGLTAFVSGQSVTVDEIYKPCNVPAVLTAGAAPATMPPQNVPAPRIKPAGDTVVPAQGGALSPN